LAKAPVVFDLVPIMGKEGDRTSNPTLRWDDEDNRPTTPLGNISIETIVPEATCDAGVFLPGECHGRSRWTYRRSNLRREITCLYHVLYPTEDTVTVCNTMPERSRRRDCSHTGLRGG
jgi:hypothetical protein